VVRQGSEAEHPLDDPDRMFALARIFDLVGFFARSISSTTAWWW